MKKCVKAQTLADSGFTKMFIGEGRNKFHPEEGAADTDYYRQKYNAQTGIISIESGESWDNMGASWYFCKPKDNE